MNPHFFILNPNQSIREIQPLQAFVSCAVNVNDEQLPHKRFDQISDHKYDIYVYGKVITKLLALAANKNTYHVFQNWAVAFFLSMVSEVAVRKNSKQTLLYVKM